MIVVLDTNVLISALFWRGRLQPLGRLIDSRQITLAFSPETADELYRTVHYPHILKKSYEQGINPVFILDLLIAASVMVIPEQKVIVVKGDPDDNKFLACALAAQASFLVSGDKHLLALKSFAGIPIVTPREFLSSF